jgi:prepilin-type N-terminal cleavage/methylation domain-containing protein
MSKETLDANLVPRTFATASPLVCQGGDLPGSRDPGFTLVEVLIALTLLAVSLLGLAMLFPVVIRMGTQSRVASETARMAQREFDQIRENAFSASGSFTDMDGNAVDVCLGSSGTSCGNSLTAAGDIDFSVAPPVGYSVQLADSSGQQYSVRWNIAVTANESKKIILAGKPINPPGGLARAVQLQTLVAR